MASKDKLLLVGVAVVFNRDNRGKPRWFVIRQTADGEWELPKMAVRRGESSVRSVIRAMGEQGGMKVKVLEEVGRSGGALTVNGKVVSQRYLYYLMLEKGGGEVLGFEQYDWLDYPKAVRKLVTKRDKQMLMTARDMVKEMEKKKKK
jgi:8-oxo-dGTP pyrophosphatase MutT (NUDIX family)